MDDWTVTNLKSPTIRRASSLINVFVGDAGTGTDPNQAIYWEAPASYLGNKVSSEVILDQSIDCCCKKRLQHLRTS